MLAAFYTKFGSAKDVLQVEDIPTPEPLRGQVRVKLFSSGVNPSDYKMRMGSRPLTGAFQIPGSDGAGIIDAVGEGVSVGRIGQRVWVFNAAFHRPYGTSAQFTIVEDWMAQELSGDLTYAQGACLGIPVMTAYRCLFSDGSIKDKTVYIVGGGGVVANYAIQLAKWGGAKVITSISSDEKAGYAKEAGADHIVNYRQQNVVEEILRITNQLGVDRIVEVDFGATGSRGTQIYAVSGQPNNSNTYIPETPKVYDIAINISPTDDEYQFVYQYISSSWTPLFKLVSNFYSKNYTDISFASGEWTVLIPVNAITSSSVTAANFNVQYSIGSLNPIASSIEVGSISSSSGEEALPITIRAYELIDNNWSALSGTKPVHLFISMV